MGSGAFRPSRPGNRREVSATVELRIAVPAGGFTGGRAGCRPGHHEGRRRDELHAGRLGDLHDRREQCRSGSDRCDGHRCRDRAAAGGQRELDLRRRGRRKLYGRAGGRGHQRQRDRSGGRHGDLHADRHARPGRHRRSGQHGGHRSARRRFGSQCGERQRRGHGHRGSARGRSRDHEGRRRDELHAGRFGDLHDRREQCRPERCNRCRGHRCRHRASAGGQRKLDLRWCRRRELHGRSGGG